MTDAQDFNPTQISVLNTLSQNGTEQAVSCFDEIIAYFQQEHPGRFLLDPEREAIRWVFAGENGTYTLLVRWDEKAERLLIRVPNIATVPPDKQVATAVLSNMINWELVIGNFQMDISDGELAFRCNLMVGDGKLGQKQLESHCFASALAVDHFMPAFQRLFWSDASPEEVLASLE